MSINKIKILTLFIFLILAFDKSLADETYPVSYKNFEYHEGGKLVVSNNEKTNQPLCYFIKPNWAGESELVYYWHGMRRINTKGSIRGVNIINAYPLESSLLTIWRQSSRLFIAIIDSTTEIVSIDELHGNWVNTNQNNTCLIGKIDSMNYLILFDKELYVCKIDKSKKIQSMSVASDVMAATLMQNNSNSSIFAYLVDKDGLGELYYSYNNANDAITARLQTPDLAKLLPLGDKLGIVSSSLNSSNSYLQIIDKKKGIIDNQWIPANGEFIKSSNQNGNSKIFFLENNGNDYYLFLTKLSNLRNVAKWEQYSLPQGFIEPIYFNIIDNTVYIVFRNGLISSDLEGNIQSADFIPVGELLGETPVLSLYKNYLILSTPISSLILESETHQLWYLNLFIRNSGKIIVPFILALFLLYVIQVNRKQKRLIDAILDLPSAGVVFVLNKNGCLIRVNASGMAMLGITEKVPMKRVFQYYCYDEHLKPLNELIGKSLSLRNSITQKINILENNVAKEWYCTLIPLKNIIGVFKGMVFTGIDITEELEKKRLSNWAQLAHDMQTNLSTIRLNAEQFDVEQESANIDRRKKIIHQVGLLIQRVRDIVTVGSSDDLHKESVNAASVCIEARVEFDETMFPNIDFDLKVLNFNVLCDKQKMIRALRNAIENSIRSIQGNEGIIKISCWSDSRYAYFSVKDDGVGMDETTKSKMLTPYFTTSQKQGGTGVGTMIMQHVIQLHGGEISISSEKGLGTEIVFTIPNLSHSRIPQSIERSNLS